MTFNKESFAKSLPVMSADIRRYVLALAEHADAQGGGFDGSSGWLRGAIGRSACGMNAVRSDTAVQRLRDLGVLVLVRRGDGYNGRPARWALTHSTTPVVIGHAVPSGTSRGAADAEH